MTVEKCPNCNFCHEWNGSFCGYCGFSKGSNVSSLATELAAAAKTTRRGIHASRAPHEAEREEQANHRQEWLSHVSPLHKSFVEPAIRELLRAAGVRESVKTSSQVEGDRMSYCTLTDTLADLETGVFKLSVSTTFVNLKPNGAWGGYYGTKLTWHFNWKQNRSSIWGFLGSGASKICSFLNGEAIVRETPCILSTRSQLKNSQYDHLDKGFREKLVLACKDLTEWSERTWEDVLGR